MVLGVAVSTCVFSVRRTGGGGLRAAAGKVVATRSGSGAAMLAAAALCVTSFFLSLGSATASAAPPPPTVPAQQPGLTLDCAADQVDLNHASLEQLQSLPDVPKPVAQRII